MTHSSLAATPDDWAKTLSGPAALSSHRGPWSTALLRHWTGTSPNMDQPPLDHHYIVQHLGGAKSVRRLRDGAALSTIVQLGAITVVPVGTQFQWRTHGPIEFAHLYLSPAMLESAAGRFEQDRSFSLVDTVGAGHPLLCQVFAAMLHEVARGGAADALYLDCLLDTFVFTLLREHSTAAVRDRTGSERLTAYRLRQIIDYIDSQLAGAITLSDLVRVGGVSTFHFVRAFKNSVGITPYQFVLTRRIARAKQLLTASVLGISDIATACGFTDAAHFSKAFVRSVGMPPSRFRRDR
jgi:AraC family transcriptional regulator